MMLALHDRVKLDDNNQTTAGQSLHLRRWSGLASPARCPTRLWRGI
jgi:hypothetical protein